MSFFDDFSSGDFSLWTSTSGAASVIDDPFGPTPHYVPTFTIVNLDHAGSTISELTPIGGSLRWTYRLAQAGGPGEAQWAVALSDPSLTTADQFAPYRTDWKLVMHFPAASDVDLIAGILGPVNTGSEANGVYTEVRCSGKDWLHWLEQPWPFGYEAVVTNVVTNQLLNPANLFKQWIGQTQETIVGDMLSALDANVGAITLTPSYEGTGWSLTLDKEVGFGDNTSVLDMVNSVAELGLAGLNTYGFDWWVDPDKTVHLVAPRKTSATSPTVVYTLNDSSVVFPPLDWTNNGPLETDSVVFGQAANNTNRIGFSNYGPSQDVYRQWTQFSQVSLAETDAIAASAAAIGFQNRFPQKDLKVTIRPDLLDPADPTAGFLNLSGQVIGVDFDIAPYHTINADFWVKQQDFYSPDGCNWLCDLTLQQVYAATDPVS